MAPGNPTSRCSNGDDRGEVDQPQHSQQSYQARYSLRHHFALSRSADFDHPIERNFLTIQTYQIVYRSDEQLALTTSVLPAAFWSPAVLA